jgi:hypothetical protein
VDVEMTLGASRLHVLEFQNYQRIRQAWVMDPVLVPPAARRCAHIHQPGWTAMVMASALMMGSIGSVGVPERLELRFVNVVPAKLPGRQGCDRPARLIKTLPVPGVGRAVMIPRRSASLETYLLLA